MSNAIRTAAAVALLALLGACAHPISITPDLASIPAQKPTVQKNAAFVIATEDRDREVTTKGGGGDEIRYFPYRELEAGMFQVLSSIYAKVTLLRTSTDKSLLDASKASYVFLPTVATESSSQSAFTWPPTDFTITIKYKVQDPAGKPVYDNQVQGKGQATYDEFKKDFGLAGKLAAQDALKKFKAQVEAAAELK
ncbi:MAG TPA: hypothetical protein VJO54_08450 [Burkholderiales bacterium]|nr:hypothetical protein [Burkholderiales bacterium]